MDDDFDVPAVKRQRVDKTFSNEEQRFLGKVLTRSKFVLRSVALRSLRSAALLQVARYRKRYARAPEKPLQDLSLPLKIWLLRLIDSKSVQTEPSCEVISVEDYFLVLSQLLEYDQTQEIEILCAEHCVATYKLLELLTVLYPKLKKLSLRNSALADLNCGLFSDLQQLQHLTELRLFSYHWRWDWQLVGIGQLTKLQHLQLDSLDAAVSPLMAEAASDENRKMPSTGYSVNEGELSDFFERGTRSKIMSMVLLLFPRLEVIGAEVTERGDSHFSFKNGIVRGQPKKLMHLSVFAGDFEDSEYVDFELLFPEATTVKIVSCYRDKINIACIDQLKPLLEEASGVSYAVPTCGSYDARYCAQPAILHLLPRLGTDLTYLSLDVPCCCEILLRHLFSFCHNLQFLDVRIYQSDGHNSSLLQDNLPVESGSLQHLTSLTISRHVWRTETLLPRALMVSILSAPKLEQVKLDNCDVASNGNLGNLQQLLSTGSIFTNVISFKVKMRSDNCETTHIQTMKQLTKHVCEFAENLIECKFEPVDAEEDSLLVVAIAEINKRKVIDAL